MKSRQLLSIVLSLIMFTGVSAGGAAFAESEEYYDELEDQLEDFCYLTEDEQSDFFTDNPDMAEYEERLADICALEDEDERIDSMYEFIDDILETRDDVDFDDEVDEIDDETHDEDDDYEMHDEDDNDYETHDDDDYDDRNVDADFRDKLKQWCEMTDAEKDEAIAKYGKTDDQVAKADRYCTLGESDRADFIAEHRDEFAAHMKDRMHDKDMREMIDRYCEMSDEDKRAHVAEHDKAADHVEKMNEYCSLDDDARADFIKEHKDEYKSHMKDKMHDKMSDKKHDYDRFCSMASSERLAEITDLAKYEKISKWCDMSPEERDEYKMKHHDSMGERMHDKMGMMHDTMMDCGCHTADDGTMSCPMMDGSSDMHCSMMHDTMMDCGCHTADDGTMSCPMDKSHMDCPMMDKMHDKMMDCTGADCPMMDRMHDKAMDKHHDKMMYSEKSDRLKAMVMSKHDISDERLDEIKMKYMDKHGDLSDSEKSELKMKYKKHMSKHHSNLTAEQKSDIHDRLAEMKAFKAELRANSDSLTDEQKQELREEFIEKAKDLQLAWINPRIQMTAGIDPVDVECKEGFSLVMKASNGVAMCLTADTALKMIDRGIVVPAI